MAPQTQVREIRVVVDTKGAQGLKEVAEGFSKINKGIRETNSLLTQFKNVFLAIQGIRFAGFGIQELTQASDTYQKLSDRIKVFEGSQQAANQTMEGLARIADSTRSSIEGVATIYSRLALSLNETGLKGKDLLFVTEQLQNSFRLSGSSAAEATAATIQLSQGLASGTLRGQELRSVLEGNALIGKLLAEELNTTRGRLMKLAEAGKITSDVFLKALSKGAVQLNKDAQQLGVTFQEATDRGLNKFNIAIGKLNQQFAISQQYDGFIQGLTNNLGALAAVAAGLAVTTIPALIAGLKKLQVAFLAATASNPLLALLALLVTALTYVVLEFDSFSAAVLKSSRYLLIFVESVVEGVFQIGKFFTAFEDGDNLLSKYFDKRISESKDFKKQLRTEIEEINQARDKIQAGDNFSGTDPFEKRLQSFEKSLAKMKDLGGDGKIKSIQTQIKELNASFADGNIPVEDYNKRIITLSTELYKKRGPIPLFDQLQKLEKENLQRLFEAGKIGAEQFQSQMDTLNVDQLDEKFKRGRITLLEYLKESENLRNRIFQINQQFRELRMIEFNKQINAGTITLREYKDATQQLGIEELNDKFKAGTIDILQYNKALTETSDKFQPGAALSVGLQNYISSAGTLSQNVSNAITQTFGHLEDFMADFLKTGKFNFEQFATSVIDDLNRIIVRALILRPLADGILGAITPSAAASGVSNAGATDAAGSYGNVAAKGAAFDGMRSNFYATGGVITGRTAFSFGGDKKGVMGESGPEAILPLTRTPGGELGVATSGSAGNTYINIVNNSDSQIEQRESQNGNGDKVLDIIITRKIKDAFASGALDKQLSLSYGLKRKGS